MNPAIKNGANVPKETTALEGITLNELKYTVPAATTASSLKHQSPYQAATVNAYWKAGWTDVFPIIGKMADKDRLVKDPPPVDRVDDQTKISYTGHSAVTADANRHKAWFKEIGVSRGGLANIALHMRGVIGLDVDQYGSKKGVQVLEALELQLGPLPATWRNSARGSDPKSGGHLFFRITEEQAKLKWPAKLGSSGIDIIQAGHRYSVVWPSRNPDADGAVYQWYRGDVACDIPNVEFLPALPDAWVQHATGGTERVDLTSAEMSDDELGEWLGDRPAADREPCSEMQVRLKYALGQLASGHTALNDAVFSLVKMGFEGHRGVGTALQNLYAAWRTEVSEGGTHGARSASQFHGEWMRSLNGAVAKVVGTDGTPDPECICGKTIGWLDKLSRQLEGSVDVDFASRAKMRSWDDTGNSERMMDYFGDVMLRTPDSWYLYEDAIWKARGKSTDRLGSFAIKTVEHMKEHELPLYDGDPNDEDSQASSFLTFIGKSRSAASTNNMLRMLAAQDRLHCDPDVFDRDNFLLNCRNGVLDLATGELRPHGPGLRMTHLSGAEFDAEAQAPKFQKFLERVQPDPEMRAYLQRVIGYSLTGSTKEEAMFMHYGEGANGKSVFMHLVRQAMGTYHQITPKETLLPSMNKSAIPNDVARMVGKRVYEAQETKAGKQLDDELIKLLTSGNAVTARFLNQEFFEFTPIGKIQLITNHLPALGSSGHAMARRLQVIEWGVQIPKDEQEQTLKDDLASEELSGVLAWAVAGCLEWQRIGLAPPESVAKRTEEYVENSDPLASFVDECLLRVPEGSDEFGSFADPTPVSAITKAYVEWCEEGNTRPMGNVNHMAKWLEERGVAKRHPKKGTGLPGRAKHKAVQLYGVRVLEESERTAAPAWYKSGGPVVELKREK